MAVSIQMNGTALVPQPQETTWEPFTAGEALDGTEARGSYYTHVLRAPVSRGGAANFNWASFENVVLTSITTHPPGQTMKNGTETLYNSGAVTKTLSYETPPGDILRNVEFRVLVVV